MTDKLFKIKVLPLCGHMYRLALRITANASDAEDAVQDAMMRLWERRDHLDMVDDIKAYAFVTVRNCSLEIISRRLPQSDVDHDSQSIDISDTIETNDLALHAISLINTLPPQQAEVMTLRDLQGCTVDEIQAATKLTAGNIRVLLCRARNNIRKHFSKK